jgi:hypothetical protein
MVLCDPFPRCNVAPQRDGAPVWSVGLLVNRTRPPPVWRQVVVDLHRSADVAGGAVDLDRQSQRRQAAEGGEGKRLQAMARYRLSSRALALGQCLARRRLVTEGIDETMELLQPQDGHVVPRRVRPGIVLQALARRILDHHVAGAATDRAAEGRRPGFATMEPAAERHETPARPTDHVRSAHDRAQLAERMERVRVRTGHRRRHGKASNTKRTAPPVFPHSSRQSGRFVPLHDRFPQPLVHSERAEKAYSIGDFGWRSLRDSNPCFSLERAAS